MRWCLLLGSVGSLLWLHGCGGDDAKKATDSGAAGNGGTTGGGAGSGGTSTNAGSGGGGAGGVQGGASGAGGGDAGASGASVNAGGSGGASGSGGGAGNGGVSGSGGVSGAAGGGGAGCPSPEAEPCEWEQFSGLACDAPACCGDAVSCVEARCLPSCGDGSESLDVLTTDFAVLARLCGVRGSESILREEAGCERPVVYDFSGYYDATGDSFELAITRFEPSVNAPDTQAELVQSLSWPSPGGPGNAVPATFGVNPSETKAVFTVTLDSYVSTLFEMELDSGETRTLPGNLVDRVVWLDDDRFLICAIALGTPDNTGNEGLYLVDGSGSSLEPSYLAGRFDCNSLGIIDDTLLAIAGSPIVGGTEPALVAVPLTVVDEVVAGSRSPLDVYSDESVQRIAREVWALQGFFPGGRWFVSPANAQYTEYRVEPLTLDSGTLSLGSPTPLGVVPGLAGFTPLYAGNERLLMLDGAAAYLVDFE